MNIRELSKELIKVLNENDSNQYACIWDNNTFYLNKDMIELHDLSFFTEDNGYTSDDINEIKNLNIGDIWVSDYGLSHVIIRVNPNANL